MSLSRQSYHTFTSFVPVLQQPGELGIPVRYVLPVAVDQRRDHVPESGEREIDLASFFQSIP